MFDFIDGGMLRITIGRGVCRKRKALIDLLFTSVAERQI